MPKNVGSCFDRGLAVLLGGVALAPAALRAAEPTYHEPFRPRFHFSPPRHWMNDPNGLVFKDGVYHLFYQYNPQGDTWGHMSWGHATSHDLFHWKNQPLALPEQDGVMIYSGSAVVDQKNTSGFGQGGKPPLVAIYTGARAGHQDQRLAFSNDDGRTWTQDPGNPVIDLGLADFRDPKVFWHDASGRWIMVTVLAAEKKVRLFASADLRHWTALSDFGPAGAVSSAWECPDLFPLPVDGDAHTRKWVLLVSVNPGGPAGGSGSQYFVGDFDGTHFVADPVAPPMQEEKKPSATDQTIARGEQAAAAPAASALWVDYGSDYYAGVTWSGVPPADGRRILLGWMSNWAYGERVPTSPWRSAMTIPRVLALRKTGDGIRLEQTPVAELSSLYAGAPRQFNGGSFEEAVAWLSSQKDLPPALDVQMSFDHVSQQTPFVLHLRGGSGETIDIVCDPAKKEITVDRTRAGVTNFDRTFPSRHTGPLPGSDGRVALHLVLDTSSLEVFAQNGATVLTDCIFLTGAARQLELTSTASDTPTVGKITISTVRASMENSMLSTP